MTNYKISNPLEWSKDEVKVWIESYDGGRYQVLGKQLKGYSGKQIAGFSEAQWQKLNPEELGINFRYTYMGMCSICSSQKSTEDKLVTKKYSNQVILDCYEEMNPIQPRVSISIKSIPVKFPPAIAMPPLWLICIVVILITLVILAATVLKNPIESKWQISTSQIIEYVSIPVISVIFTYFHIWLALWMTFYPLEFVGIGQFGKTNMGVLGWQGIIPNKGEKMARKSVQMMTTQLMDVKEVFSKIDPKIVVKELEPILYSMIKDIIEAMANKYNPSLWNVLPLRVKNEIIEKIKEESPEHIENMMEEIKSNITLVFDIEDMVVKKMMRDKQLLVNMFLTCGYSELCFIRDIGAYMGGIFGVLQMILWIFYKRKEVVFPVFGLCVGTLTNWLALKMIFEPVNPKKICGCITIHGLFLKRQYEVSGEYGRMVAADILNSKNIIETILQGPASDKLFVIVLNNVKKSVDSGMGVTEKFVALSIGKETYQSIKDDICTMVVEKFPDGLWYIEDYTSSALDLEATLRDKMRGLSYEQFEGLLHPVFQEDEWKLVVMGGALGLLIGLLQAYVINV